VPATADDDCFWLYSSGSTGSPKGAVHRHRDMAVTSQRYGVETLGIREDDVFYSEAKLFFAYGLGNAMTFPLSVGATTVLNPERPTPDGVAALLRKHPITVFFGVPTFYAAFLASPNAPQKSELTPMKFDTPLILETVFASPKAAAASPPVRSVSTPPIWLSSPPVPKPKASSCNQLKMACTSAASGTPIRSAAYQPELSPAPPSPTATE